MKPEIIKPEESNLRDQVIKARDGLLEQRDLIKRIDSVETNDQYLKDLLKDCRAFIMSVKQEIKSKL